MSFLYPVVCIAEFVNHFWGIFNEFYHSSLLTYPILSKFTVGMVIKNFEYYDYKNFESSLKVREGSFVNKIS